jgi:hypothetical protein
MHFRGSTRTRKTTATKTTILFFNWTVQLPIVRNCFKVKFPGRWTGGPNAWPTPFLDLTALDFPLWGYVKQQV